MRTIKRYLPPAIVAAAAGAAVLFAPAAAAETHEEPTLPKCVDTGGAGALGGSDTECATPGNVELDATPPVYAEDWGDMWGPGLFFP